MSAGLTAWPGWDRAYAGPANVEVPDDLAVDRSRPGGMRHVGRPHQDQPLRGDPEDYDCQACRDPDAQDRRSGRDARPRRNALPTTGASCIELAVRSQRRCWAAPSRMLAMAVTSSRSPLATAITRSYALSLVSDSGIPLRP